MIKSHSLFRYKTVKTQARLGISAFFFTDHRVGDASAFSASKIATKSIPFERRASKTKACPKPK